MSETEIRTYRLDEIVRFRKTTEEFGGLSNMAPGFPMVVLGHRIRTSEALYQACRFPHMPEVQAMILNEGSPMTAKMRSKPFRKDSRPDWDEIRVSVMRWCLRVKLIYNWSAFSGLLIATGDRQIVEDSRKDTYWGAVPQEDGSLKGQNVLGRLLMELRDKWKADPEALETARPPNVQRFQLLDKPIESIVRPRHQIAEATAQHSETKAVQPSFL